MFDFDLSELYEVETRILNQAVKRNIDCFPKDFMFQLSKKEWESLRSQIVMSSEKSGPGNLKSQISSWGRCQVIRNNVRNSCN